MHPTLTDTPPDTPPATHPDTHDTATATTPTDPALWNETPFRTHLFNAFSVLLPPGEQFVIDAVSQGLQTLAPASALREECERFVCEERAHQRAHRLYNQRLQRQGYAVAAEEVRLAGQLSALASRLTLEQRLCLAAAFEHITAGLSELALRSTRLLAHNGTRQSRLWRWHCNEELAHATVVARLLAAHRVAQGQRVAWYVAAGLWMAQDVVRLMQGLYRSDAQRRLAGPLAFWRGAVAQIARSAPDLPRLLTHAAGYVFAFKPHPQPQPQPPTPLPARPASAPDLLVRPLQQADLPALLSLEHRCWTPDQAANEAQLRARIETHPDLCLGAFCPHTGSALASLFMSPADPAALLRAQSWDGCVRSGAEPGPGRRRRALFGISLSSTHPGAVQALMRHFWPRALRAGWRHIYLGTPVPGLGQWLRANPGAAIERYVGSQRRGLPLDPQLRYYHQRGFRRIVAVLPGYFPHPRSANCGVLLRGTIPGAWCSPCWRWVPLSLLDRASALLFRLL